MKLTENVGLDVWIDNSGSAGKAGDDAVNSLFFGGEYVCVVD